MLQRLDLDHLLESHARDRGMQLVKVKEPEKREIVEEILFQKGEQFCVSLK